MKILPLILISAILSIASMDSLAAPLPLEEAVANDIQSLLDDTVNEGEQTAHVRYKRKIPQVQCKISQVKGDPAQRWAFCKVDFDIRFEEYKGVGECSLLYRFDPKDASGSLIRGNASSFDSCVEHLSESLV